MEKNSKKSGLKAARPKRPPSSPFISRIQKLELDLKVARQKHRRAAALLKEANDRLQISNSELQTTNSMLNAVNSHLEQKISELNQARIDAENEKLRMQAVMESLPVGIAITNELGGNIQANKEFDRLWGGPRPITRAVRDYAAYKAWWADTDQAVMPDEWASARAVRNGETVTGQLIEIQRFDGSHAFVINSASPVKDVEGEIIGSAISVQDITELHNAERALKQLNSQLKQRVDEQTSEIMKAYEALKSERQRFYDALETLPAYLVLLTPDYRVSFANRFFRERFGESGEKRCFEYFFGRTSPCETCKVSRVMKTKEPSTWEWLGPDGRNYNVHDFPFTDSDGSRLILEIGIDITEVKKAQAALTEAKETLERRVAERTAALADSEERLERAQELAHLGSWELNLAENKLVWSDEVYRIYGMEPQDCAASFDRFLEIVHPDDKDATRAAYAASLRDSNAHHEIEHRVIRANTGEIRWVHEKWQHMRDDAGTVVRSMGMILDVTERRLAEDAFSRKHAELQTILDSMRALIYYKDKENRFLLVNKALADAMGLPKEELEGRSMADLYPAEQAQAFWEDDLDVIASGMPKHGIEEPAVIQGDVRWYHTDKIPYRDAQGEVIGIIGLSLDITEDKRMEAALERSARRFELLAQTAGDLLQSTNPQKTVESLCRRVMEHLDCQIFLNFLADDKVGKLYLNACAGISEEDIQKIQWLEYGMLVCDCAALKENRIVTERIADTRDERTEMLRANGIQAYACHALLAPDGNAIGTLSFGTRNRTTFSAEDLSLMKAVADQVAVALIRMRGEQILHRTAEELARSNKDLEQFAYVSSHDLREPLRTVTGFVQILQDRYQDKLDAKAGEYISYAVEGAKRMQQLIDDLLAYSRVGSGAVMKIWNTQKSIDRALNSLKGSIEESNAWISVDPLPTAYADGTLLAQVFQNLIGNAIKFRSGEPPEIRIGARRSGASWLFWVRDNGIGMEPEYKDKIFVIFKRLHSRDKYPGTGIGLAICKKIVEQHHGKIWVESELGKGSTFYFTLPDKGEKGTALGQQ
jgi:PAS domain S-box-containing protein